MRHSLRISIITDAWHPQFNGVVRTLEHTVAELEGAGHTVQMIHPGLFRSLRFPPYPDIRLAVFPKRKVAKLLREFNPDAIHIVTEAVLGLSARSYAIKRHIPFTTSFHTRFPEYAHEYSKDMFSKFGVKWGLPTKLGYDYLRWFHSPATSVLTATESLCIELNDVGISQTSLWPLGVDLDLFHPDHRDTLENAKPPILMYMGRVALEKNIGDFLNLMNAGTKYVVGEGPEREDLARKYPTVRFVGMQKGNALSRYLASADVLVFPSKTDTLGLAMIEAQACGTAIAAYPVAGPLQVVRPGINGALSEDLGHAVREALKINREECRRSVDHLTWENSTKAFLSNLALIR